MASQNQLYQCIRFRVRVSSYLENTLFVVIVDFKQIQGNSLQLPSTKIVTPGSNQDQHWAIYGAELPSS